MSWASFISAGVGIWAKKAAVSLGVGFVTFVGFQAVKDQLSNLIQNAWGGLPGDVYAVLALGGFVDGVGIWLGAVTTAISLVTIKRLGVLQS
ncbi:hypothetical protein dqs_2021 [Azoarcus olearius]|uniref:DUF2523 family protein n=1 Tax=Azoarcus sp. (strain BH72) TaxID=418699 RepID=UPI00080639CF|nr:DUF2523 family protein [Azoarcus olearius]ANQ85059.1 hypothetical protein dqs_2021 [Azoarcus olearius]